MMAFWEVYPLKLLQTSFNTSRPALKLPVYVQGLRVTILVLILNILKFNTYELQFFISNVVFRKHGYYV